MTPLDEWSARRRDLYLTTQHWKETDIHATGGIRTYSSSKLAVAAPALDSAAGGIGSCQHQEYERVTTVCGLGNEHGSCLDAFTEGIFQLTHR
jgi:hypothetical protein